MERTLKIIALFIFLIILCLLPTLVVGSSCDNFTIVVKINIAANFTYQPQHPKPGDAVTFTDTSYPDIAINWTWDFGDGSISYQENPTHTYYYAGTYQVTLTVVNEGGINDTILKNITVSKVTHPSNNPPTADANGPYYRHVGQTITFDGSKSSDLDGTIVSYDWDFGDGNTGVGVTSTHIYSSAGTYTMILTVTDNEGATDSDPTTVTISVLLLEEPSNTTMNEIEEKYNVVINLPFYANDTDFDGIVDTFTDPNGVLASLHNTTIGGNASFLIYVYGDLDKLFMWDAEADTITPVTHNIGTIIDTVTDTDEKTITMIVSIEKANWTYIEVTDPYPDNLNLTVKTSDGRTISPDKIWRENNKVYVLDDPATEYLFIYGYEPVGFLFDVILELTTDSVFEGEDISALITLINVGESGLVNGTVNYTLSKSGVIIWSKGESVSVLGQKAFNKTILTEELSSGEYTYEVVYSYGDNQTASAQDTFTVKAQPSEEIPLWIIVIIVLILIIIIIIAFLIKAGYIHIG